MSTKILGPITPEQWAVYKSHIGAVLDRKRRDRGLSHKQLAHATGRTIWQTMRWCRGTHAPGMRELLNLSRALDCKLADLVW